MSFSSVEGLQQADYDQKNFILATVFGFVVLCCLGSCMICSHVYLSFYLSSRKISSKIERATDDFRTQTFIQ